MDIVVVDHLLQTRIAKVVIPFCVGDGFECGRGAPSEESSNLGDLSVGQGVAEAGIGLYEAVVEAPGTHAFFLVIGVP